MLLFFLDSINCTGLFLILVPLRKESVTVIVKNLWGFSTEVLLFELFWKKKPHMSVVCIFVALNVCSMVMGQ